MARTCRLTFPSLLTETKHETTYNAKQTSTRSVKIAQAVIGITKLVTKYFLEQMAGILCKSQSWYESDPLTITTVHTNGTIRVQWGTTSE